MPRRSVSANRCCYSERGRRCRRDGTGNPPLCNPHKIAFVEASQQRRMPGGAIVDLFDSFLSGKKINRKKIEAAWFDFDEIVGSGASAEVREQFRESWTPRPAGQSRAQQPQEDPREVEARREFAAAKRVMGFAESEPITADAVRERKKVLARRYHPDRKGGSLERMQEINAAADVLLRAA